MTDTFDRAREGCTTVSVAHDLSTAVAADRVAVLAGHGIAEVGSHEQLLAHSGRYARMWAARNHAMTGMA